MPRGYQPVESRPVERGIGCASVIPGAFFGVAGLADYAGPQGWLGISEFLGWAVLCWAAGLGLGVLLRQARYGAPRRYLGPILAVVAIGCFTYAPYWLGLGAPMIAKVAFTTSLQVIGTIAPFALAAIAIRNGARHGY